MWNYTKEVWLIIQHGRLKVTIYLAGIIFRGSPGVDFRSTVTQQVSGLVCERRLTWGLLQPSPSARCAFVLSETQHASGNLCATVTRKQRSNLVSTRSLSPPSIE